MDGIYRVYAHRFDEAGQRHDRIMGRFAIEQGLLLILEDHYGKLHHLFPQGLITARTKKRMENLERSGYHQIVREDHVNQGHHPEHARDMDLGEMEPEARFMVSGEGVHAPQLLEIWSGAVVLAGRRLSDMETRELMNGVHAGKLILSPMDGDPTATKEVRE